MARYVGGRKFELFTRGAMVVYWFSLLPYYLVAIASSLGIAFGQDLLCFYQWALIVIAVLVVMLQFRTLKGLALAAAISSLSVIVAIVALLWDLAANPLDSSNHTVGGAMGMAAFHNSSSNGSAAGSAGVVTTHLWPAEGLSILDIYGASSSFIFAYQGQSMFLEIMREMKVSPRGSDLMYCMYVCVFV